MVGYVHDAGVIVLAIRLQHGHQHCVFALLLVTILVQLCEEVFILVLSGGGIGLVLHLEHDADHLSAVVVHLPEDEISLCAPAGVVVLLEVGVLESCCPEFVEFVLAEAFEGFADHLG